MTFTQEQLKILSKWEYNFHCAIYADWSPNPGEAYARLIHQIYKTATGDNRRVCYNCQHSLLSLMRDTGTLYFKDKAEMASKKAVVETKDTEAEQVPKMTVKTVKKTTKTTKKK